MIKNSAGVFEPYFASTALGEAAQLYIAAAQSRVHKMYTRPVLSKPFEWVLGEQDELQSCIRFKSIPFQQSTYVYDYLQGCMFLIKSVGLSMPLMI